MTLSRLVLNNMENQQRLANEFNVENVVYHFMQITDSDLKIRALLALSLFAYNNLENQCVLKQTNALGFPSFQPFIESSNLIHSAMACFQVERISLFDSHVILPYIFSRSLFSLVSLPIVMMNK